MFVVRRDAVEELLQNYPYACPSEIEFWTFLTKESIVGSAICVKSFDWEEGPIYLTLLISSTIVDCDPPCCATVVSFLVS